MSAGRRYSPQRPIRVFPPDDHEVVRRGLRDLLDAEPDIDVVGDAGTVGHGLARGPALRPDVAVLAKLGVARRVQAAVLATQAGTHTVGPEHGSR